MISTHARHRPARRRWRRRLSPAAAGLALALVASAPPAAAATPGPWAWGSDAAGQLCNGTSLTADQKYPSTMGASNVAAVSGGESHTLLLDTRGTALTSDDRALACGSDEFGQLGDGNSGTAVGDKAAPVPVKAATGPGGTLQDLTDVKAVAGGANHSLALRNDGTVWAWGHKKAVGDGGDCDVEIDPCAVTMAQQVPGLSGVSKIAAGNGYSLALVLLDGSLRSWGGNGLGSLGDGTTTERLSPVNVKTPDGSANLVGVLDISAAEHSLAVWDNGTPGVLTDDKVLAWGGNARGQLGFAADLNAHPLPTVVNNGLPDGIIDVAAAAPGGFSMALRKDGAVWAWGANFAGQLGRGFRTSGADPLDPPCLCHPDAAKVLREKITPTGSSKEEALAGVTAIAVGSHHALAINDNGTPLVTTDDLVYAWGANEFGQLGNGFSSADSTSRDPSACDNAVCQDLAKPVKDSAGGNLTGARVIGAGGNHSLAA
ncbi:MAG: hypothetical protein M3Q48_10285 [Actinomycetota bacterium]|nr:hypothetical protein [Actinomycetota bacterium]